MNYSNKVYWSMDSKYGELHLSKIESDSSWIKKIKRKFNEKI